MIPGNIKDIIDKLKVRTENNQAIWNKSSGENGFKLSLQTGLITIDKWLDNQEQTWYIDFAISNDKGDIIEQIQASKAGEKNDFDYLDAFYTIIRRKYLKVDETLKSLLDELNSTKSLGTNDKNEPIDDLPF
jgi:hypothetical protein